MAMMRALMRLPGSTDGGARLLEAVRERQWGLHISPTDHTQAHVHGCACGKCSASQSSAPSMHLPLPCHETLSRNTSTSTCSSTSTASLAPANPPGARAPCCCSQQGATCPQHTTRRSAARVSPLRALLPVTASLTHRPWPASTQPHALCGMHTAALPAFLAPTMQPPPCTHTVTSPYHSQSTPTSQSWSTSFAAAAHRCTSAVMAGLGAAVGARQLAVVSVGLTSSLPWLAARRLRQEPEPFEAEFDEDEFEDGEYEDLGVSDAYDEYEYDEYEFVDEGEEEKDEAGEGAEKPASIQS